MKRFRLLLGMAILAFVNSGLSAKITLPSIWSDNMVLQQNSTVNFRGKATPGKTVSLKASWNLPNIQVKADSEGNWNANVATPDAGGPYELVISDGEELRLKNILVGEVWFCSGQSNMEMPVKGFRGQPVYNSQPYIVKAKKERPLRLYTVKRAWNTLPQSEGIEGNWVEQTPEEVARFSATAYFFGNLLQEVLNIPVGLIHSSWSASKIETWMSRETLAALEVELPDIRQKEFGWPGGTPTLLWNAMVSPWKGFPIKGVLWYQGEANTPDPNGYKKLFPAMVSQWREFFQSPELPIYYVQLPPFQSKGSDRLEWALFRQVQLELMSEVPHVGMVTSGDAGHEKFIHPPHKIKIGERLAYWALGETYGIKGFSYKGPVCKSAKIKDNSVELMFDYSSDGLNPENELLTGFEIAGKDGRFLPAKAEIINGSARVKVWHNEIPNPAEIRYCFRNYMEGNLYNNAGIPASPFRIELNTGDKNQ